MVGALKSSPRTAILTPCARGQVYNTYGLLITTFKTFNAQSQMHGGFKTWTPGLSRYNYAITIVTKKLKQTIYLQISCTIFLFLFLRMNVYSMLNSLQNTEYLINSSFLEKCSFYTINLSVITSTQIFHCYRCIH